MTLESLLTTLRIINYSTMTRLSTTRKLVPGTIRYILNEPLRGLSPFFNRFTLLTSNESAFHDNHRYDLHRSTDPYGQPKFQNDEVSEEYKDQLHKNDHPHDNFEARGPPDLNHRNHQDQKGPNGALSLDGELPTEVVRHRDNDRPRLTTSTFLFAVTKCPFVFRSSTAALRSFASTAPCLASS